MTSTTATRSTDTDALLSRVSAAKLGYFKDSFSTYFVSASQRRQMSARPPLINVGTHSRVYAFDRIVSEFATVHREFQVINLGAGTDTRFWRLKAGELLTQNGGSDPLVWIDLDFEESTALKAKAVMTKAPLKSALVEPKVVQGGLGLSSKNYHLLSGDLRDFSSVKTQLADLVDESKPTLVLMECVCAYLETETVHSILSHFSSVFSQCLVVLYDPFSLHDTFGQVMIRNLALRDITLLSALETPTLKSIEDRFAHAGFAKSHATTVLDIYARCLPTIERDRVRSIERLDEYEELNLVLSHYAVSWASKNSSISALF